MTYQPTDYGILLAEELTADIKVALAQGFDNAYRLADICISSTLFLQTPGGVLSRGYLIRHAVEYQLVQLIEEGVLPFDYEWRNNAGRTGLYQLIKAERFNITASQLQHVSAFPRRAVYRANHNLNNKPEQLYLPLDASLFPQDAGRKPHIVLAHGYKDLTFLGGGIPHAEKEKWLYKPQNFLPSTIMESSGELVGINTSQPEEEVEATVVLKEKFQKFLQEKMQKE